MIGIGQILGAALALAVITAIFAGMSWLVARISGRRRPRLAAGLSALVVALPFLGFLVLALLAPAPGP